MADIEVPNGAKDGNERKFGVAIALLAHAVGSLTWRWPSGLTA